MSRSRRPAPSPTRRAPEDPDAILRAEQLALGMLECTRCGEMFLPDRPGATRCSRCSRPPGRVRHEPARATHQPPPLRRELFASLALTTALLGLAVLPIVFVPLSVIFAVISRHRLAEDPTLAGRLALTVAGLLNAASLLAMLAAVKLTTNW